MNILAMEGASLPTHHCCWNFFLSSAFVYMAGPSHHTLQLIHSSLFLPSLHLFSLPLSPSSPSPSLPLPPRSEHGVSRSVAVVLAYLMWSECLSLKLLYQELKERKPDIR